MKKIIFLTFAILVMLTKTGLAQQDQMGRKTAEQRADLITKNMTEKLSLTTEQTEEAREIVLKREKLSDAGKLSKEKQKAILNDINKILTKDQQKQWEQARKADKNKNTE